MRSKDSSGNDDRKRAGHAEPGRPWREKVQGWREATVRLAHDVRIVAGATGVVVGAVGKIIRLVEQVSQWLG
ncbi:hypothetical protein D5R93_09270 [Actinomyces lilanjuaniae]|uniref:Uncharacterized protein n=1 Tax=Actinomyces lilanjuaniae TaxID=2321394 RepID=A0ABM6Z4B8_9ACTO|nr:hypothetical protein [Actinomyces lilanjuaniae]AYD90142.1 hypothetical protein D5R93_09270 [Actinomyces lilanjuaniae]